MHLSRRSPWRIAAGAPKPLGVPDMTTLNPYLSFRDNAKEAMTY